MERILIINDNPMDVRMLRDILKDRYEVVSSLESGDGVNKARLSKPGVILLDSAMPRADGEEVILAVKNCGELRDIPVILTAASQADPDTEEKWIASGAADYITKPYSPGLLKARVGVYVELRLLRKNIEMLELADNLTLLPNRRSFDEKFKSEWARSVREGTTLSISFIDIDNFTAYNEGYGRSKGDDALRLIASEINYSLSRKTDFIARFSPEKIAVIMPNTTKKGARVVYERVKKNIQNLKIPHAYSETADIVTVSIGGYTAVPRCGEDMFDFAENADKMLYEAKAYGRNMIVSNED